MDLVGMRRSMQWILDNRVDSGAAGTFLTLPHNMQEDIRRAGMLYNSNRPDRNPSAMLARRCTERFGGFVEVPRSIRRVAKNGGITTIAAVAIARRPSVLYCTSTATW